MAAEATSQRWTDDGAGESPKDSARRDQTEHPGRGAGAFQVKRHEEGQEAYCAAQRHHRDRRKAKSARTLFMVFNHRARRLSGRGLRRQPQRQRRRSEVHERCDPKDLDRIRDA